MAAVDGGEDGLSSGSPTAQRRLSKVNEFVFSELVLQDVETLDLAESSAMLGQLRQWLEAESGCLMLQSRGALAQNSALAAAERCKSIFQAAELWRKCATCLIYCVLVRNL